MTGKSTAIVRLLVALLLVVNFFLMQNGMTPLEIDEALLTEVVSGIAALAGIVWTWYKNNSVTKEARAADGALKTLKNKPIPRDEAEAMMELGVSVDAETQD